MQKPRGTWLFPLILALLMGGVSFWLDRVSQIDIVEAPLDPNQPKYQIDGIAGERFDQNGALAESLSARRAWQLPQQTVVHIDAPQLTLLEAGTPLYQVSARQANYHTDSRQVVFAGDVVLDKRARGQEPAGVLRTSRLTVDTTDQSARTDAPVQYRYGLSHGSAVGVEYNRERGFLNLSSRIKATIYDPKQP